MNTRVEKACGIDIHQAFLAATILTSDGIKDTKEFSTSLDGLLDLKTWILENRCQRVAIESTGIYHIPAYIILEGKVETIVANPLQIKYIPGRKNDEIDSEWIAEVCLNGQIKPSYIPCREIRIGHRLGALNPPFISKSLSFDVRIKSLTCIYIRNCHYSSFNPIVMKY